MRKAPRNPEPTKQWKAFLNNHREAIAAMDFFTVPTLTFDVLYCFFVIAHNRRRILQPATVYRQISPLLSLPFVYLLECAYLPMAMGIDLIRHPMDFHEMYSVS